MENRRSKKTLLLVLAAVCIVLTLTLVACNTTTIQKVKFKVTFDVDGVSYYEINTQGTEVLQMPADPTKEGFIFDGWYWDKDAWTRQFTASSLLNEPLKEDMRVYAKWKSENEDQDTQIRGTELSAKTLTVDGTNLYTKVSNATETFSFINEISVADGAKFTVHTDISCSDVSELKSKTTSLENGDNVLYILVSYGNDVELYTATIRRRPIYSVTFNTNGGVSVPTQYVEEDDFADEPTTTRRGYTFDSWNYDLSKPIVKNTTITASWIANKYKITYVMNGGTDCNNVTEYTIEDGFISLKDAIGENLFCGWYLDDTFENYVETINCNELKDYTLYAQFDGTKGLVISNGVVLGYNGNDKDVAIPTRYKNISVTNIIKNAFSGCRELTSIIIPDSVTSIGYAAFSGCSGLTEMTIPFVGESRKTANDNNQYPFGYIFGAGSYEGGAETKQQYYVSSTSFLERATYYIPSSLKKVTVTGGNILFGAFDNCSNLTDITIPNNITSIGESAFFGCSGLTSVTIPDNMTDIGENAFYGCSGLNAVYIQDLTKWCEISFGSNYANPLYYAHNLYLNGELVTDLVILDSVESICDYLFYGCIGLKSVVIPDSVTSIGKSAFRGCSELTSIIIPDGVTSIGESAFRGCSGLNSITIPNSVTSIDREAFRECDGLTSASIPDSVESIGAGAFLECSKLTNVNIPNGIKNIYGGTFKNCSSLTSVIIPDSVTAIGSAAFYGCSSLTGITIPDSVTKIGVQAFGECSGLISLIIGNGVISIGIQAFIGCSGLTSVTIGNSVEIIDYGAFYGCSGLVELTIPDSVTIINGTAFYGCSGLNSVTIPDSVTSIGSGAFYGCSSLTSMTIPDSITIIDDFVFCGCSGLMSVIIPDSVTSIDTGAFSECSKLNSITISDKVTDIGEGAFYGCNELTSVYYKGTAADWTNIFIDSYNSELTNATRYYYSEEEPSTNDDGNYWHYVNGVVTVWVKEN